MNTDEDLSDTEEEIYVYAEFEDSVNIDKYSSIHILGIDTKTPIFQLDSTFFTGTYENPLGTYMFFEEGTPPEGHDPLFDKIPEKYLKYLCKTRKFVNVEHAYITPKEGKQDEITAVEQEPLQKKLQPMHFKSIQEALEKFKKEWDKNNIEPDTPK